MLVIETIFSAIFNILSIYIGFRVVRLFLKQKEKTIVSPMVICFFVWIENWLIYYVFNQTLLTITSFVVGMLVATVLLYDGTIVRKIVSVFSALALGMVSESLIWVLLFETEALRLNAALGSLLSSLFQIFLILILERGLKLNKTDYISSSSYFNIITIILGSIVLGEVLVTLSGDDQGLATIGLSIICLIDVSTYYIYDKINEVYLQKIERKAMEQRVTMYENQLELIEQSQNNIKSLRHDMKNHLLLIQSYMNNHEYEKVQQYIEELNEGMVVSGLHVQTGNQEVDAILNYMVERAKAKGAKVETQIEIPNECFMHRMDLNILLSNLLDNALEALDNVDKRYLYIGMKYHKGVFVIRVHNSFDGMIIKKGRALVTRKEDKGSHGLGLRNVSDIIKKYNGEQQLEVTGDLFKIAIILYVDVV